MLYKIYKNVFLKNWIAWLSLLFGIALLAYLFFIFDTKMVIDSLRKITLWQFAFLFVLKLVFAIVGTVRWKIILNFYNRNVSLWKLYLFKAAVFAISYLTPTAAVGGQAVGALLLKNEKVPLKIGLVSVLLDSILVGIITFLITIFVVILFVTNVIFNLNFAFSFFSSFLFILLLGLAVFWTLKKSILGFNLFLKSKRATGKLFTALKKGAKLFIDFLSFDKKAFVQASLLTVLSYILVLIELFFLLYFLGIVFLPLQLTIVETGNVIAFIFPISQALGITESAAVYTHSILGSTAATGIAMSLILRARHILITLIGIAVLIFYGIIKLRRE